MISRADCSEMKGGGGGGGGGVCLYLAGTLG